MRIDEYAIWERFDEVEWPFTISRFFPQEAAYFGFGKSILNGINDAKRGARPMTFNDLLKEFGHIYMTPESKLLKRHEKMIRMLPDYEYDEKQDGILRGYRSDRYDLDTASDRPAPATDYLMFYFVFKAIFYIIYINYSFILII